MDPQRKAIELVNKHGKEMAQAICDNMITELQDDWNQDKIDFWLDVKLVINSIE